MNNFIILLITSSFQLVAYTVCPGKSELAVKTGQILQPDQEHSIKGSKDQTLICSPLDITLHPGS